jgi:hypothetical protein
MLEIKNPVTDCSGQGKTNTMNNTNLYVEKCPTLLGKGLDMTMNNVYLMLYARNLAAQSSVI